MQFSKGRLLATVFLGGALLCASSLYIGSLIVHQPRNILVIHKQDIETSKKTGLKYYDNQLFTGQMVEYYQHNDTEIAPQLKRKESYLNGKKHDVSTFWFDDGAVGFIGHYFEGRLHGPNISFWRNGNLRAVATYDNGALQGLARQWYVSGEKFKKLHYVDGIEVGLQQAWRQNGKLYANYENVNGRIYGLKKANLCFGLDNEKPIF